MTTYRSVREFGDGFPGGPTRHEGRFVFPVEAYIVSRGEAYSRTYRPEAFVCLSESIDLHRIEPETIAVPMTMVAVLEDQLVPCLLYTSDAADERSSVDLGGRRIIKKKKKIHECNVPAGCNDLRQ